MKILILDAGNTRLKWSLFDVTTQALAPSQAIVYASDQIEAALAQLPNEQEIQSCYVASVLGENFHIPLHNWVKQSRIETLHLVDAADVWGCGIKSTYQPPQRLGIDRYLAMLGARQHHTGDVLVIDAGSAVTLDYLRADNYHLGGLILPGLGLMRRCLTRNLVGITEHNSAPIIPRANTTDAAISSGTLLGLVCAIEGLCLHISAGDHPIRVLTGGDAALLSPRLEGTYSLRPDLVLEGMLAVLQQRRL